MPPLLSFILAALTVSPSQPSLAEPPQASGPGARHVTCDLILPSRSLTADATTTIGVRFRIAKGWHLYWNGQNDSGAAPTLDFSGSDPRLSFGTASWPVPVRQVAEGEIVDHVYEGECIMLVPLTIAKDGAGHATITLRSDVLVCSDSCLPGRVGTTTTVGVGPHAGPPTADAAALEKAAAALPREPGQAMPFTSRLADRRLIVEPSEGRRMRRLTFMPGPGCEVARLSPDCESRGEGSRQPRLEVELHSPGASGIVQCEDDAGVVTSWRLESKGASVSGGEATNAASPSKGTTTEGVPR